MNMMQTAQVPPALEALMSMGARPTAPGPGGQPVPTVAASIAQQQSPAGIEAVMPGVQQQAMNMAQAQQPVRMGELPPQLQQAIQQARGPQGQGVASLPAPNMSFADGGVVGYAGPEGSFIGVTPTYQDARRLGIDLSPYDPPEVRKEKLERLQKAREFEEQRKSFGEIPTEASVARDAALQAAYPGKGRDQDVIRQLQPGRMAAPPMAASPEGQQIAEAVSSPPQFDLDPNNPQALNAMRRMAMQTSGVERQAILNKIAELEAAQPSRSMAPEAPGIPAALPPRPVQDRASVEAAGKQYPQQTQDRIRRMQDIERQRSELAKSMPDLNAEGIAALEAANRAREEMLAQQRGDDKFNRRMALYREIGGRDRDAYGRAVANQQARDQAANQADLLHKQAVIKLREAQQAKQLGQFDRALGFEKEAAELENKANDFELRAKQIATQMATNEFSGLVSLRGQDMQAQRELKSMAPAEQMMAERAINDWLNKNPGKSYAEAVEWYKTIGQRTPPTDRAVLTYAQAAKIVDERLSDIGSQYALQKEENVAAQRERRQPRTLSQMREDLIRREMAMASGATGGAAPAEAGSALPPGVTVKRIGQ